MTAVRGGRAAAARAGADRVRARAAAGRKACGSPGGPSRGSAAVLLRVGSRGSRLALTQATLAAERLRRPGVEVALVPITTAGDRDRTKPFGEIGARGVFVKEIEEALLAGASTSPSTPPRT